MHAVFKVQFSLQPFVSHIRYFVQVGCDAGISGGRKLGLKTAWFAFGPIVVFYAPPDAKHQSLLQCIIR